MADPKLLELLAQGRDAWNNPKRHLETVGGDRRADLTHADLTNRSLRGFDFAGANLDGANLSFAMLDDANFDHASLCDANLERTSCRRTDFDSALCKRTNFAGMRAFLATFAGTDMRGAILDQAELKFCLFDMARVDDASLQGCDVRYAVLSNVRFKNANFADATFGETKIALSDLTDAKGLTDLRHSGPSSIDMQTLLQSRNLPDPFLKGIGVPDVAIVYYHSLAISASPIQLYSCFISYSSKDEEFCRRLHNDLQAAGVRCWFAPEDLKIGDRSRTRIEESIRIYDKLLIVLSEHSIRSPWVEHEIEAAFEQERRRSATVLFPIRLDDAMMDTNQAWAASIRRERHIGNFTGWKNHDAYQRAFDRLIRDLRASNEDSASAAR